MNVTFRRIFCGLSILVFSFFALGNAVSAEFPQDQIDLYNNGIYRFSWRDDSCTGGAAVGTGATDSSGVDRFLQVIALQESHGDPKAHNPKGSASGKYQYIVSTWKSVSARVYPPASTYPEAWDAPEAVQDAVAKIEYTEKFVTLGGDIFKLALSHFLPAAITNPGLLDIVPKNNKITPRQYANQVIEKMNNGFGSNIAMHYNEAPDFATYYAKAGGGGSAVPVTPSANPDAANANSCGGGSGGVTGGCGTQETLKVPQGGTGVNICYFNQGALKGGKAYGKDYNWPGCGCLPTSLLEIRTTMEKNPGLSNVEVLNGLVAANGVWSVDACSGVLGGGLSYLKSLKYDVQTVATRDQVITDATIDRLKGLLSQGYLILTHSHLTVDSAATSGTKGHFLVIHAVDGAGNFYVANPGAKADNGKLITPQRIKAWLDEFYAVKKTV